VLSDIAKPSLFFLNKVVGMKYLPSHFFKSLTRRADKIALKIDSGTKLLGAGDA